MSSCNFLTCVFCVPLLFLKEFSVCLAFSACCYLSAFLKAKLCRNCGTFLFLFFFYLLSSFIAMSLSDFFFFLYLVNFFAYVEHSFAFNFSRFPLWKEIEKKYDFFIFVFLSKLSKSITCGRVCYSFDCMILY